LKLPLIKGDKNPLEKIFPRVWAKEKVTF